MILKLAYYGDPILRKKAAPITEITDEIKQLVKDMQETMIATNGCGLAAPQVHRSIALFLVQMPKFKEREIVDQGQLKVYINPKVISYSEELQPDYHGCLSVPGLGSEGILRPMKITVQATDINGNLFTEENLGPDAIAICHENDHLNGVLYFDRCSAKFKKGAEQTLRKIKKQYNSG